MTITVIGLTYYKQHDDAIPKELLELLTKVRKAYKLKPEDLFVGKLPTYHKPSFFKKAVTGIRYELYFQYSYASYQQINYSSKGDLDSIMAYLLGTLFKGFSNGSNY